jgi:prepilin-type N-terminal cleavage/methylation domain-containing protein
MTNDERNLARIRSSGLTSPSAFDIRLPRRSAAKPGASTFGARGAFTLIELLVVIAIIIVLAGLILSTMGYVRKKGARSRAETEIAAMSAACESYKADNAIYPRDCNTDQLIASSSGDPTAYQAASLYLYKQLSGDTNANFQPPAGARTYFTFKPNMLSTTTDANGNTTVNYIRDPFGNSYGYSTLSANYLDWQNYVDCVNRGGTCVAPSCAQPSTQGYNPTFDLWSTAGTTSGSATDRLQWIKNW